MDSGMGFGVCAVGVEVGVEKKFHFFAKSWTIILAFAEICCWIYFSFINVWFVRLTNNYITLSNFKLYSFERFSFSCKSVRKSVILKFSFLYCQSCGLVRKNPPNQPCWRNPRNNHLQEAIFSEGNWRRKEEVFLRSLNEFTNESTVFVEISQKSSSFLFKFPSLNIAAGGIFYAQ